MLSFLQLRDNPIHISLNKEPTISAEHVPNTGNNACSQNDNESSIEQTQISILYDRRSLNEQGKKNIIDEVSPTPL